MPKLIILGSSNAVPTDEHDNTHMVLVGDKRTVLIDSVGHSVLRLKHAGIEFTQLTDLIVTHFHPDHVGGVPGLFMDMWLLGRKTPLNIYGLKDTLARLQSMMELYEWSTWPGFFDVNFHIVEPEEMHPLLETEEFSFFSSPVKHLIPTIGLRFEFHETGKTLAYSCDTEPCPAVERLGKDVDILIHEAAGNSKGHSSAEQAGQIAQQANARSLLLIHYQAGNDRGVRLIAEAEKHFSGSVALARDFMSFRF